MNLQKIEEEISLILEDFFKNDKRFREINSFVVVCSISKVEGKLIDTIGDSNIAEQICKVIFSDKYNPYDKIIQCCEHLNRALIVEKEYALKNNLEPVNVVPIEEAGGTFATTAYKFFKNPVVVESVKVDGGIDIGLNMCGMHLKEVAQPLITKNYKIGKASVLIARTRPKLIGGIRAVYK